MVGGEEVLEPVFGPLHGTTEAHCRDRRRDPLRDDHALRPERAADVRDDHAEPVVGALQDVREAGQRAVRVLRGEVQCEEVVAGVVLGDSAARLDRHRDEAGDPKTRAHHAVSGGERAVDVACGAREPHQRLRRVPRLEHRIERLVVDFDELGAVLGERACLGDDGRHRLPNVQHFVACEDGMAGVS